MDYILNDIKANILEYLVKEISVRTRKLEEYNKTFNTEGIGFYLHNSVSRAYKTSYVLTVLHHTREDIAECVTLESKEQLISYFTRKIDRLTEEMLSGRVVPFNTCPMVNLTAIWEHEAKPELIKFFKGCLNIINKFKCDRIKIQSMITSSIRNEIGEYYLGDNDMADALSKLLNEKVVWEDSKIDDASFDGDDDYIKTSLFTALDSNLDIRITYGDITLLIGCIDVKIN
jgi:hypothetical protein